MQTAQRLSLGDGTMVSVISAPAFIATKLEVFHDRGQGDFILSHDVGDIIAVVDGRPELLNELKFAEPELRKYVIAEFSAISANRSFVDSIGMHLLPDEGAQGRSALVFSRLKAIASLAAAD